MIENLNLPKINSKHSYYKLLTFVLCKITAYDLVSFGFKMIQFCVYGI